MKVSESKQPNRSCLTCGKPYHVCRSCIDLKSRGVVTWRMSCDTPECYQVLSVLSDYFYHLVTKEDARIFLDGVLTDDMKPYDVGAAKLIAEIFAEDIDVSEDSDEYLEEEII